MTRYLLDSNVIQEMHRKGNVQVHAWLATVDDHQLRLSVITFQESRLGLERERLRREKADTDARDVRAKLAALDTLAKDFEDRIISIDVEIADEWARLLAISGKHDRDTALAATARVHDLVLVTRNVKHVTGRDVRVLDPFSKIPKVRIV